MVSCAYTDPDLLGEPTLDEILADPMIQLIMQRDGVEESKMRGEMDRVQRHYETLSNVQ